MGISPEKQQWFSQQKGKKSKSQKLCPIIGNVLFYNQEAKISEATLIC